MSFKISKLTPTEEVLKSPSETLQVSQSYMKDNTYLYYQTFDGYQNNIINPILGKTETALKRNSSVAYGDGISTLVPRTPTPREISNNICSQILSIPNKDRLTDFFWLWGQFIDHELDMTPANQEDANMTTPGNDTYPNLTIPFKRSEFIYNSSPRQQVNKLTSFIDGFNVYGNTDRCCVLRKLDGSGKMKTILSDNNEDILPLNIFNLDNDQPQGTLKTDFFVAGDTRCNENIALTAIHTLFVREHNRLCDNIKSSNPNYSEEEIFQQARRQIIALMQKITFNDFLPILLGNNSISPYQGYNKNIDPSIATEFSTVGYRLGHTMISSTLDVGTSSILLRNAFFTPSYVKTNGIDQILLGFARHVMQEIDNYIVDDLRNFLFGPPTMTQMLDLASLNIQRGRDHGITDYNSLRVAYGLTAYTQFSQITSDTSLQTKLSTTYSSINGIDPWIGALCEDHVSGAQVGPLLKQIIKDQFERIRDGDRFWWETNFMIDQQEIKNTTLTDIVNRNCNIVVSNVFKS